MWNNKKVNNCPWNGIGFVVLISTFLVGIVYAIYQWMTLSNIEDPIFVGIIMANTYAIYRFTMFLKSHLIISSEDFENSLRNSSVKFTREAFICEVFNKRLSLLSGFIFGSMFLTASIVISPWGIGSKFNVILGIFLFSANILTGMALYSLFIYFRYSLTIGGNIEVKLWDRSSPSIMALLDTNRYVVLATAFVSCAGIISVMFSKFSLDYSIIVFSILSVSVILLAYIVPLIPVTTQIRKKKKNDMSDLSKLIQLEYSALLQAGMDSNSPLNTEKFDAMISVYKSVKDVRTFPPVGVQSINTAMSVAFLTMLPSLIDFVLNQLAGA